VLQADQAGLSAAEGPTALVDLALFDALVRAELVQSGDFEWLESS
jgi:hypothetical protein